MWAMAQEVGLEFVDLDTVPHRAGGAVADPRGHGPPPHGAADRSRQRGAGRRHGQPHRRLRHGRPAHDHGPQFHPGRGHPVPDRHSAALRPEATSTWPTSPRTRAGARAGSGFELESLQSVVEDAPIVRYVNLLILQALNERASDIHIEPTPKAPPDPVPDRRRDARRHLGVGVDPQCRGQPTQGAGRDGHHRAPDPPRGPGLALGQRPPDRPPAGHAAVDLRRDGRHAAPRQVGQHPEPARAGVLPRHPGALRPGLQPSLRGDPGHRAHRGGQDHHLYATLQRGD